MELVHPRHAFPIFLLLCCSMIFPLSALIGWNTGYWLIGAPAPQSIPMAPLTAIVLSAMTISLGLRLWFLQSRVQIGVSAAIATAVILVSAFILLSHLLNLHADIEEALGAAVPFDTNVVAGRMSPLTAFNILLDSSALLLLTMPASLRRFSGYLALASLMICMTTLLGYIYGTPLLYGGKTIPMALGTALTLLCVDVALLLLSDARDFPKRLFVGNDLRAHLTRTFLPATLASVVMTSLVLGLLSFVWSVNPAIIAVGITMSSAVLTTLIIIRESRRIGEKLERVESLEASLALSNRKFGTFMKHGPFASFIREADGNTFYGNAASKFLFSRVEAMPHFLKGAAIANEVVEHDIQIKDEHGQSSSWHIINFVIPSESGENLVAGIGIDLTKIRAAEEEKDKAQKQLRMSYKMAALGEMSGSIAHEINNPIAIILGKSRQINELLDETPINVPLVKKFAVAIDETSRRIASVVNGLRTISRQAHKDAFISASVLNIIDGTVAICTGRFREKNVELKIDECPETLLIDCQPAQIAQVLLNLLNNAFDAVEDLSEKWVHVSVTSDKTHVFVRVADSGVKIPTEIRSQMFTPFYTTKSVGKGTGLGLSISSNIISAHGGSLMIDDDMPHTCFVVRLPIKKTTKV